MSRLGQQLGCSKQNVEVWSTKYNWVARCRAYDAHRDNIKQEEAAAELRQLVRRNVRLASAAQGKIAERLKELSFKEISAKSIPAWLRAFSEMEKTARGAPAYTVALTGPEGGAIQHEHTVKLAEAERELAAILGTIVDAEETPSVVAEPDK